MPAIKSTASAVWEGTLRHGKGQVSAAHGAFTGVAYTFAKRFEGAAGAGTTPEELVAAAHAACFAMAFSSELGKVGFTPTSIAVKAIVTLEPVDGHPTVTSSALEVDATVPGIEDAQFQQVAAGVKVGCPISRLLNTNITLVAKLG